MPKQPEAADLLHFLGRLYRRLNYRMDPKVHAVARLASTSSGLPSNPSKPTVLERLDFLVGREGVSVHLHLPELGVLPSSPTL